MEAVKLSADHPLAQGLAAGRERYNSRFLLARHSNPQLDGQSFLARLTVSVAPVMEAVCAHAPHARDAALDVLYQLALETEATHVSDEYWGLWTRLLAALARPLSESPREVAAPLTNALHAIYVHPGARPAEWVEQMIALADLTQDAQTLLAAGHVAAWRAGMPHLRRTALAACRSLELEPLARKALGIPPRASLNEALSALELDPWLSPSRVGKKGPRTLQLMSKVGGFSGYGSIFDRPPRVFVAANQLYAHCGERYWAILGDAFGASCYPCPQPVPDLPGTPPPARFAVSEQGDVVYSGVQCSFPALFGPSSYAASTSTLAVVRNLSFRIYLIGACESA